MEHLCDIQSLSTEQIRMLIHRAQSFLPPSDQADLIGESVGLCFFEPSTRTRLSFELAAKHLGAHVLNLGANTSLSKGETIADTSLNLAAMGMRYLVIRHPEIGIAQQIADCVPSNVHVINAGDGTHAHPSQALLDMLTIANHKADFERLKITIVGDLKHSRVARSQIAAMEKLGVADIQLVAPDSLQLEASGPSISHSDDLKTSLKDADVVIALRTQVERMSSDDVPNPDIYRKTFGLSEEKLALAKPDAILMHPGPVVRGIELDDAAADGPQSVILEQVTCGVAMRMAILQMLSNSKPALHIV